MGRPNYQNDVGSTEIVLLKSMANNKVMINFMINQIKENDGEFI